RFIERQTDDLEFWKLSDHPPCGLDAIHDRHIDIHDPHPWLTFQYNFEAFRSIGRFAHDFDIWVPLKKLSNFFTHEFIIVDQYDTDASRWIRKRVGLQRLTSSRQNPFQRGRIDHGHDRCSASATARRGLDGQCPSDRFQTLSYLK